MKILPDLNEGSDFTDDDDEQTKTEKQNLDDWVLHGVCLLGWTWVVYLTTMATRVYLMSGWLEDKLFFASIIMECFLCLGRRPRRVRGTKPS